MHTQPVGRVAAAAAEASVSGGDLRGLRIQLVADAGAALLALLTATTLGVFKPRGLTPYGQRKQDERRKAPAPVSPRGRTAPGWVYVAGIVAFILVLAFAITHLTGGGLGRH